MPRCRKRTAAYDATKAAASPRKADGSTTPARNIITNATRSTTRNRRESSSSALAAQTNADQAHQTNASNNNERPTVGQARSSLIVVETCVTAKTKTRSHSNSTGLVRRSTGQESSLHATRWAGAVVFAVALFLIAGTDASRR